MTCPHGGRSALHCDLCNPEAPGPGYDFQTRPYIVLRADRPAAPEPDWLDRARDWMAGHGLTRLAVLVLACTAVWFGGHAAIALF